MITLVAFLEAAIAVIVLVGFFVGLWLEFTVTNFFVALTAILTVGGKLIIFLLTRR